MRKRRIYLVLLILVVAGVVVLIVTGAFREREPEYGGKRLSEWVECIPGRDSNRERMPKAPRAVYAVGTNAIPYLLKWIQYEPPSWKTKSFAVLNRIFPFALRDHQAFRAEGAMEILPGLGRYGEFAVPGLALLMNDTRSTNIAYRASMVLREIAEQSHSAAFALLTNNDVGFRISGVWRATELRIEGISVVPVLLSMLSDPDPTFRAEVTNALRRLDPEALERAGR